MIKITKKALKQLKQLLPENKAEPFGIRIGVRGKRKCVLNYFIAMEKKSLPEDEILEIDGLTIFIDKKSITTLREIELDYLEVVDRTTFVFRTSSLDKKYHCLNR